MGGEFVYFYKSELFTLNSESFCLVEVSTNDSFSHIFPSSFGELLSLFF